LVAEGCTALHIVPIFLGQGGHVRQDLPARVARVEAAYPGVSVTLQTAIGEEDAVLDRIAEVCVRGLERPR
jgi:sirohydrochlorin cobaltochelatase